MKTIRANWLTQRGMTLLELMIVIVIVSLLAAIAIPSYKKQIVRTNRSNAMATLQSFSQAMERYYAQNNTYATAVVGTVFPSQSPLDGPARYTLSLIAADLTTTTYTIRATPTAGTMQVGDGYIELTNTGDKRWDRNNNGSIGSDEHVWQ